MKWSRRLSAVSVVAALVVGLSAAPASAAPLVMGRDRSDNGIFFSYDAETRSLPEYGSATRISSEFDRVDFIVQVGLTPEDSVDPLAGMISLRLRGKRAVHYKGTFVIPVRNDAGEVVLRVKMPADLVLRPRPGKRRANLAKTFDVPGGWYSANAIFRPAT